MDKELIAKLTAIVNEAETGERPAVLVRSVDQDLNADKCRFSCNDRSVAFPCDAPPTEIVQAWRRAETKPGTTGDLLLSAKLGQLGNRVAYACVGEY